MKCENSPRIHYTMNFYFKRAKIKELFIEMGAQFIEVSTQLCNGRS